MISKKLIREYYSKHSATRVSDEAIHHVFLFFRSGVFSSLDDLDFVIEGSIKQMKEAKRTTVLLRDVESITESMTYGLRQSTKIIEAASGGIAGRRKQPEPAEVPQELPQAEEPMKKGRPRKPAVKTSANSANSTEEAPEERAVRSVEQTEVPRARGKPKTTEQTERTERNERPVERSSDKKKVTISNSDIELDSDED